MSYKHNELNKNVKYDVVVVIGSGCYIYIKERKSFIVKFSYIYVR